MDHPSRRLAAVLLCLSLALSLAAAIAAPALRPGPEPHGSSSLPAAKAGSEGALPVLATARLKPPPSAAGTGPGRSGPVPASRWVDGIALVPGPAEPPNNASARAARMASLSFTAVIRARATGRLGAPPTAPPRG